MTSEPIMPSLWRQHVQIHAGRGSNICHVRQSIINLHACCSYMPFDLYATQQNQCANCFDSNAHIMLLLLIS